MSEHRRVIPATCEVHRGARDFCNLVVTHRGGEIVLDPHADQCCVITLGEPAAAALFDSLGEWLG